MSGWSDGKIRAFAPQSGKLLFTIHDAHRKQVCGCRQSMALRVCANQTVWLIGLTQ